ncbi:hypothetical protein DOY81_010542 [Sarcophaga bullata]|nr:hypothetical protein DOY81_010542 [Sarcophaga bullata]
MTILGSSFDKLDKNSVRAIPADYRLFLTLIYLVHGTSRQYLSLTLKMSVTVVRRIVLETCEVIWNELSGICLFLPNTYELERIAKDFKNMWNLPNCMGAIDGKHVAIICPPPSETTPKACVLSVFQRSQLNGEDFHLHMAHGRTAKKAGSR